MFYSRGLTLVVVGVLLYLIWKLADDQEHVLSDKVAIIQRYVFTFITATTFALAASFLWIGGLFSYSFASFMTTTGWLWLVLMALNLYLPYKSKQTSELSLGCMVLMYIDALFLIYGYADYTNLI